MRSLAALIALAFLSVAGPAMADAERPAYSGLPGVAKPKPLVQPMPEPMANEAAQPDGPAARSRGSFRIGNWDVKVGGHVRIDVGTTSSGRR